MLEGIKTAPNLRYFFEFRTFSVGELFCPEIANVPIMRADFWSRDMLSSAVAVVPAVAASKMALTVSGWWVQCSALGVGRRVCGPLG